MPLTNDGLFSCSYDGASRLSFVPETCFPVSSRVHVPLLSCPSSVNGVDAVGPTPPVKHSLKLRPDRIYLFVHLMRFDQCRRNVHLHAMYRVYVYADNTAIQNSSVSFTAIDMCI